MQRAARALSTATASRAASVATASASGSAAPLPLPLPTKVVARTRPLPARKQVLYAKHQHLLTTNKVVLFLRPSEFTAHEWRDLRADLAQASAAAQTAAGDNANPSQLKLTVLRPGLLPALLRDDTIRAQFDASLLSTHLAGPLAVLTAQDLHPPTLQKVLKVLDKYSTAPARNAPPVDPKEQAKGSKSAGAVDKAQRLPVLSSLFEAQAADHARTVAVSKMPSLDTLRAQIVGLLSMPGARITGILGQRAVEVSRTLQGFKQGLEDGQKQQSQA
ncbi:hypothetical protein ACM66B_006799 [Microbotryomycetes sp. NB124-2]